MFWHTNLASINSPYNQLEYIEVLYQNITNEFQKIFASWVLRPLTGFRNSSKIQNLWPGDAEEVHGIISRKDIYVSSCSVKNMAYTTRNIYFVQCYNVIILLILKRCYYSFWVMSKKQNIALQANRRIYYLIPRSLTVNRRNSYFWLKYHD